MTMMASLIFLLLDLFASDNDEIGISSIDVHLSGASWTTLSWMTPLLMSMTLTSIKLQSVVVQAAPRLPLTSFS
jgi:hypothetical protein